MKLEKETIEKIFSVMDFYGANISAVEDEITDEITPEEKDFFISHYDDFYGVWNCYRLRRLDEMSALIEIIDEPNRDEILDFYSCSHNNDEQ